MGGKQSLFAEDNAAGQCHNPDKSTRHMYIGDCIPSPLVVCYNSLL